MNDLEHHLDGLRPPHSLKVRQREFGLQYVLNGNAAEAARKAGYALENSKAIGNRLLRREDVRAWVRVLRQEAVRRAQGREDLTLDDIADEMISAKAEAVASLADLFRLSGGVLRLATLDEMKDCPRAVALIDGIELDDYGTVVGYQIRRDAELPAFNHLIELAGIT